MSGVTSCTNKTRSHLGHSMKSSGAGKTQVWFGPPQRIGKCTTHIAVAICMVLVLVLWLLLEQERFYQARSPVIDISSHHKDAIVQHSSSKSISCPIHAGSCHYCWFSISAVVVVVGWCSVHNIH